MPSENIWDLYEGGSVLTIEFGSVGDLNWVDQGGVKVFISYQRIGVVNTCVWRLHHRCVSSRLLRATGPIFTIGLPSRWYRKELSLCCVLCAISALAYALHVHVIFRNLHVFCHIFVSVSWRLTLIVALEFCEWIFDLQLSLHASYLQFRSLLNLVRAVHHWGVLLFDGCPTFKLKLMLIFCLHLVDLFDDAG